MYRDVSQRLWVTLAVTAGAILCLLPTALRDSFTTQWFTRPIALGLDISGGVHLVYGVKASEAVKSRMQTWLNGIRAELRTKKIAVSQAQVTPAGIEIALLTDSFVQDAKALIEDKYKELTPGPQRNEDGKPVLTYSVSPKLIETIQHEAIDQAVETLRNRVDQFGVAEPIIQRSGEDRIILQMPGVSDVESVKKVVGSVAKLEFRLVPSSSSTGGRSSLRDKSGNPFVVEDQARLTGDAIADARVGFDNMGRAEVLLTFTRPGATAFSQLTSENIGKQLAIILDGIVYSAPTIQTAINDGRASITGSFTVEEANQLKIVLKAGALPAPLEVLEERTVGPTLGMESIKKGLFAMAVGFVAILLFMMVYYKKSGLVAVTTLLLNALLMVGILSLFGATLTLPGLAGLALTIGVAVDSNVIIFERIRDELRNGVKRDSAVRTGFDKAFSAIFDANVTTLLAGVILYYFGTGPVKGFAVTLCIGIVTTLFCAVYVARMLFDLFSLEGKEGLSI